MKHYLIEDGGTAVFIATSEQEVYAYMYEKEVTKLYARIFQDGAWSFKEFVTEPVIYALVFETDNGENYDDYGEEQVNMYVGTSIDEARKMFNSKVAGAYPFIDRKVLQHWVNGICIKNETIWEAR